MPVVLERAPFSSLPVIVSLLVRKCLASIMNEAPAAFGMCTKTQRCGGAGRRCLVILSSSGGRAPTVCVCLWPSRRRAIGEGASRRHSACGQPSAPSLLGVHVDHSSHACAACYREASMDAGGPNGQHGVFAVLHSCFCSFAQAALLSSVCKTLAQPGTFESQRTRHLTGI